MTVAELIERLSQVPGDLPVLALNYNDAGFDDLNSFRVDNVARARTGNGELGEYVETGDRDALGCPVLRAVILRAE